jgi:hypothetical protein
MESVDERELANSWQNAAPPPAILENDMDHAAKEVNDILY